MTVTPSKNPPQIRIPARLRLRHLVFMVVIVIAEAILAGLLLSLFIGPGPRIAYLSPAAGGAANIWVVDTLEPEKAEQITFSENGIVDFDISPDGRQIAFSEQDSEADVLEIKLLDINSGDVRQLTDCASEQAACQSPAWRPNGNVIAYERARSASSLDTETENPSQVWVIDLDDSRTPAHALIDDESVLGHDPKWSQDGSRLSFFDAGSDQIVVYHWPSGDIDTIDSNVGVSGALSPDGKGLVYPELMRDGTQTFSHLTTIDLTTGETQELSSPADPVLDRMPTWHPDGEHLAFARQYLDVRWTRGHQVYTMTIADRTVEPLVVDVRYATSYFEWNHAGDYLLVLRAPEANDDAGAAENTPEIWVLETLTGELTQVVPDGFHPHWMP